MQKYPFSYEIKNATSGNAEIQIYGYIGKWDEVDYPRFQKIFRDTLSANKQVTLRIHSGGGSIYEGLAIYDLIRSSDTEVTVIVEGMAASMASVIALAGDTIKMTENAFFMMHAASGGVWGTKKDLQAYITQLEQCESRLQAIYNERTTADTVTIKDWFENGQDNWLDADKCMELSVCDEIIKPVKTRKFDTQNIVNKTPEEAFRELSGQSEKVQPKVNKMKKEQLVAMLTAIGMGGNLTASSDDATLQKQLEAVFAKAKKADDLQQELQVFKETQAKALIVSALSAGKITAGEKDEWEQDAIANYALVAKSLERMSAKPDVNGGLRRTTKPVDGDRHELFNGRENWSFGDWQEKYPKGLARIEDEAPGEFETLFNQQYNK